MSIPILPFAMWESGTNQNSVPANDNSLRNQILGGLIISDSTDAQPGSPTDGDAYIMTGAATGTQWATFDQFDLAIFDSGTWYAFAPVEGIRVNIAGILNAWNGAAYTPIAGGSGSGDVVGPASATADAVAVFDGTTGKLLKNGVLLSKLRTQAIQVACSDETTALTTGTAKATFRMPYAFTLTGVRASVTTAPTGAVLTVDINEAGTTILSTKITIDATEKTSTTAATPPVISDASLADDAEITIDIDTVGSTIAGAGLKVTLIGYAT